MSGIVGIVAVGGAQFGATLATLLTFSVLINISLAVLNLLPLPPLDGGRMNDLVIRSAMLEGAPQGEILHVSCHGVHDGEAAVPLIEGSAG